MHEGDHPARPLSCMLTQEQAAQVVAFCLDVGRSPLMRARAQCRLCRAWQIQAASAAAVGRVEAVADIAAPKRLGLFAWQLWKTKTC